MFTSTAKYRLQYNTLLYIDFKIKQGIVSGCLLLHYHLPKIWRLIFSNLPICLFINLIVLFTFSDDIIPQYLTCYMIHFLKYLYFINIFNFNSLLDLNTILIHSKSSLFIYALSPTPLASSLLIFVSLDLFMECSFNILFCYSNY